MPQTLPNTTNLATFSRVFLGKVCGSPLYVSESFGEVISYVDYDSKYSFIMNKLLSIAIHSLPPLRSETFVQSMKQENLILTTLCRKKASLMSRRFLTADSGHLIYKVNVFYWSCVKLL